MWFHCHSDTHSILSNVINVSNPNYQPIPKPISMPTYRISDWKFELEELQLCGCVYNQARNHPKNPCQVERKSAKVIWPYPQHWPKYKSQKVESPTKISPTFLANKLEKNLDEIGWKITLIWIRMGF